MTATRVQRLATASGADLARLLEDAAHRLDHMSDADRLEVVAASARLDAWTAALRAKAVVAVFDSAREDIAATSAELEAHSHAAGEDRARTFAGASHDFDDEHLLHRRVGTEVALVLGVSTVAADREVDFALGLHDHPQVSQALCDGRLDRTQAVVILDGIDALAEPMNRTKVLTSLLGPNDTPDGDDVGVGGVWVGDAEADVGPVRELRRPGRTLWSIVPGRLRQIVRREAGELEPETLERQARRSASERRVVFDSQPDFMTELHLRTTTPAAAAAYQNLDRTARAVQSDGDKRSLDQLRADIAIGWLTEGAFGTFVLRPAPPQAAVEADSICLPRPRRAMVSVTMAATTLLGLDEVPATLHGPSGPIPMPAGAARELASRDRTRWRRLLYDPATGIATDLSRSYRPTRRMADFVRSRDGERSRLPISCATHLELDHVIEFDHAHPAEGGPTCSANLACGGRRDHHLKSDDVLQVSGDANEVLTITTPAGLTYESEPFLYANPEPEPEPDPDPWGEPPF